MAAVLLAEIAAADPATAAPVAVRVAGGGSRAYNGHRGIADWRSAIVGPVRYASLIGFDQSGWTGGSIPTVGNLALGSADRAFVDQLARLYWPGSSVTIWRGDDASAAPAWTVELQGKIASATFGSGQLQLTISDLSGALSSPIAANTFAGTGGIEGGTDATGRVKRRSWGRVFNVEGRLWDAAYNIYEFGDPAFPLHSFRDLRDKGRSASEFTIIAWKGSIAATLAELRGAVVPAGGGVVAPSIAAAKWWTQPSGPLSADLWGELDSAGFVDTVAGIASRVVSLYSDLNITNVAAATALRPGQAGIHCDDASETAAALLDRLLLGASLVWVLDPSGAITIRPFGWVQPIAALRSQQVTRKQILPPLATRTVGYLRNYRVQSDGEIAADILAGLDGVGNLALLDAVDFDTQVIGTTKPADNATNSADPASPFGNDGKTVSDVQQQIAQAELDIFTAQQNIQALVTTYGTTAAAAASAMTAGQAKTDAESARDASIYWSGQSATEAGHAQGYAQTATDQAGAAAYYANLSSQTGPGALDQNPFFIQWPDAAQPPTGWSFWAQNSIRRDGGQQGHPYAAAFDCAAYDNKGLFQDVTTTFGSYVLEMTGRATDWRGAGVLVQWFDYNGAYLGQSMINCAAENDNGGWLSGADGGGGVYQRTWSKLLKTNIDGAVRRFRVYAFANWEGFDGAATPGGTVYRAAKSISFDSVVFRKALQPEIDAGAALAGLGAKADITYVQQVGTDATGNAVAQSRSEYNAKFNGAVDSNIYVAARNAQDTANGKTDLATVTANLTDQVNTGAGPLGGVVQRTQTMEASYGRGGNVLGNSSFVTTDGWTFANGLGAADASGLNGAGEPWQIYNENNLYIHHGGGQNSSYYSDWQTYRVACDINAIYQFTCLVAQHRCATQMYVERLDGNGNHVDYILMWNYDIGGGQNGGRDPSGWNGPALNFTALGPVNILLRKLGSDVSTDSWAWFCRPQVTRVPRSDSAKVPYSPSANKATLSITQGVAASANALAGTANALAGTANNTANDARSRTSAFFSIVADAGGGVASVTVYADGYGAGVKLGGNVFIDGNLTVGGSIHTDAIADYAVTTEVSSANPYCELYADALTTVASVTIVSTGRPITVQTVGTMGGDSSSSIDVFIYRNGTAISTAGYFSGWLGSITGLMREELPAGTYTYDIRGQISSGIGSAAHISSGGIIARETKK